MALDILDQNPSIFWYVILDILVQGLAIMTPSFIAVNKETYLVITFLQINLTHHFNY